GRAIFEARTHLGAAVVFPQIVKADGSTALPGGDTVKLPVDERVVAVAKGDSGAYFDDAHVAGTHVRLLTFPYLPGYAVEVARSLNEVDHALSRIRIFLLAIAAGGIAVAAALGLIVSRAALAPVRRLTQAAERVRATGDL